MKKSQVQKKLCRITTFHSAGVTTVNIPILPWSTYAIYIYIYIPISHYGVHTAQSEWTSGGVVYIGGMCELGWWGGWVGEGVRRRVSVCVFFRSVSFCFPLWFFFFFGFFFFRFPRFSGLPLRRTVLPARPMGAPVGVATRAGLGRPAGVTPKSGDGGSATGRGHGRAARRRAVQFNVRHRLRSCSMFLSFRRPRSLDRYIPNNIITHIIILLLLSLSVPSYN